MAAFDFFKHAETIGWGSADSARGYAVEQATLARGFESQAEPAVVEANLCRIRIGTALEADWHTVRQNAKKAGEPKPSRGEWQEKVAKILGMGPRNIRYILGAAAAVRRARKLAEEGKLAKPLPKSVLARDMTQVARAITNVAVLGLEPDAVRPKKVPPKPMTPEWDEGWKARAERLLKDAVKLLDVQTSMMWLTKAAGAMIPLSEELLREIQGADGPVVAPGKSAKGKAAAVPKKTKGKKGKKA